VVARISSWIARALVVACALFAVVTGAYAARYVGEWRAGRTEARIRQQPYRSPGFQLVVEGLRATIPPDASLLLEPVALDASGATPAWRWHLFLNEALAPIRCYVRQPARASGTLVDYPLWLRHHFPSMRLPEFEGQRERTQDADALSGAELAHAEERALEERGIEWRLRYPQQAGALSTKGALASLELARRAGDEWQRVEIVPRQLVRARVAPSVLTALATALCLWLAGHALLALARARPRSLLEGHASALGLGLVVGPALGLAYAWVAGPLSATPGRVLLGAMLAAGLLALWRNHRAWTGAPEKSNASSWSTLQRPALFVPLALLAFALFQAASVPMHSFDAIFHFAYKAKLLFHEGLGTSGWTDLVGPVGRIATHPDYPPGLAALGALAGSWRGEVDERAVRMLMPFFLLAGAGWLWAALAPRSRWAALGAVTSLCALPFLYFVWPLNEAAWPGLAELVLGRGVFAEGVLPGTSPLLDGTGDLPLGTLLVGALFFLVRALRAEGTASEASLAGVLLGGALLTKNEGLVLAGILVLALGLALVLGRVSRLGTECAQRSPARVAARLGLALALAGLVALPWLAVRNVVPSIDEGYPAMFTRENLASAMAGGRPHDIAAAFWQSFTNTARWGFLWLAFALGLAALVLRRGLRELDATAAALVTLLALALYFTVLLVSPWSLELLFATLIPDRLLVHVAPLAIWCVSAAGWPQREAA
jgi:hypothetical protein